MAYTIDNSVLTIRKPTKDAGVPSKTLIATFVGQAFVAERTAEGDLQIFEITDGAKSPVNVTTDKAPTVEQSLAAVRRNVARGERIAEQIRAGSKRIFG